MIRVLIRSQSDRKNLTLYYVDPDTRREVTRSAETDDKGEAERAAARWEAELVAFRGTDGAGWDYFRRRFDAEHLATKAPKTLTSYTTALNAFSRLMNPATVSEISASVVSQFKAAMVAEGYPLSTVACYLTHLRGSLNWAASIEMIAKAPRIQLPSGFAKMRGRPITEGEYQKMLDACNRYPYRAEWRRFLELLWLSGLRIGEACRLTWDGDCPLVDLDAKPYPQIVFTTESHKARRDDATPIPPDFATWLRETSPAKRRGLVGSFPNQDGENMPADKASDRVSEIGRAAGVVVNTSEKSGSAQDFRRSYGTRWAKVVRPATLQRMMRHASLTTTMQFYVGLTSADAGADLYGGSQNVPTNVPKRARKPTNGSRSTPKKRGKT